MSKTVTAIAEYLLVCIFFVFAALMEYSYILYTMRTGKVEKNKVKTTGSFKKEEPGTGIDHSRYFLMMDKLSFFISALSFLLFNCFYFTKYVTLDEWTIKSTYLYSQLQSWYWETICCSCCEPQPEILVCGLLAQIFTKVFQLVHPIRNQMAVQEDNPGCSLTAFLDGLSGLFLLTTAKWQDPELSSSEAHFIGKPENVLAWIDLIFHQYNQWCCSTGGV